MKARLATGARRDLKSCVGKCLFSILREKYHPSLARPHEPSEPETPCVYSLGRREYPQRFL